MDKRKFFIINCQSLVDAFKWICSIGFDKSFVVEVKPLTRTLEQNAKLWAMLNDVSEQVNWHGQKLTPEDWKHVFSAALNQQRVVPNIDSTGFVVLGQSTSKMTVRQMADMIELINAFGAERGVRFKDDKV